MHERRVLEAQRHWTEQMEVGRERRTREAGTCSHPTRGLISRLEAEGSPSLTLDRLGLPCLWSPVGSPAISTLPRLEESSPPFLPKAALNWRPSLSSRAEAEIREDRGEGWTGTPQRSSAEESRVGGLVQEVTELGEASGEVHVDWSEVSPVASLRQPGGAGGTRPPSRSRFFCFMRRFWNQILTCVSLSSRVAAISTLRARLRYLLKWNSFSSSVSCRVVKLVRRPPGAPRPSSDTFARGGARKGPCQFSPLSPSPPLCPPPPASSAPPVTILSSFSSPSSLGSPGTPPGDLEQPRTLAPPAPPPRNTRSWACAEHTDQEVGVCVETYS